MSNKAKNLIRIASLMVGIVFMVTSLQTQVRLQAAAATCSDHLRNGGFETDDAWNLPITAYRAAYSTAQQHTGARSMRTGIVDAAENRFSYSSASQPVLIPRDTQTATLSLWLYAVSTEGNLPTAANAVDDAAVQAIANGVAPASPLAGDRQYVLLLNPQNTVLARLWWTRSDARSWQQVTFDVSAYAGQTVRVQVGAYNDGVDGVTALFVDDVALVACPPTAANYLPLIANDLTPTPTLILTAPPTTAPTPTTTAVWSDPTQAIEVFSPVNNGLYHSPMVVNGFSRTFEGNVNLRLTDKNGQVLAERNTLGGSVDGFAFFDSALRFTVGEMISGTLDVFESSAKDGSEIHKVTIPVVLLPGQRVIDLNTPAVGAQVCSPIYVTGYSNTFEAHVAVTLNRRDGTSLAQTSTFGGNLGIYADFSTLISYTVSAPQPVLVGAFEESPAGFGLVDYTRHPLVLHPANASVCP